MPYSSPTRVAVGCYTGSESEYLVPLCFVKPVRTDAVDIAIPIYPPSARKQMRRGTQVALSLLYLPWQVTARPWPAPSSHVPESGSAKKPGEPFAGQSAFSGRNIYGSERSRMYIAAGTVKIFLFVRASSA